MKDWKSWRCKNRNEGTYSIRAESRKSLDFSSLNPQLLFKATTRQIVENTLLGEDSTVCKFVEKYIVKYHSPAYILSTQ
jgi:hypothetical protein